MRKGFLITIALLIVAWFLMLSYQIFTQTAMTTFAGSVPFLSSILNSNVSVASFICSFAWMFVLSSVISGLIFGKQRKIFIQFLIGLVLTVTASGLFAAIKIIGFDLSNPNTLLANPYAHIFSNGLFAFFYLSLPFIFMIVVDLRDMTKSRRK
jgi:hypothetical protein